MHEFTTDILRLQIDKTAVGNQVLSSGYFRLRWENADRPEKQKYETMLIYTLAQALCAGGTRLLEIGPNDIAFTLRSTTENAVSGKEFIFFDTAPGGAGFCDQLLDDVHTWFAAALDVLNCSEGCGDSCYSCLRAYENQLLHTYLDRNLVIEGLQAFMAENWSETVRNRVSLPLKNLTQHRNVT